MGWTPEPEEGARGVAPAADAALTRRQVAEPFVGISKGELSTVMRQVMRLIHYTKACGLFLLWLVRLPLKRLAERKLAASSGRAQPIPEGLGKFCEANARAWRIHELQGFSGDKRVLVEGLCPHKAYLMINLVIGSHLMRLYKRRGAALLHEPNSEIEAFFRAYGVDEFHYLSDRKRSSMSGTMLRAGAKAFRLVAANPTMDGLLQHNRNGVSLGKSAYDWYLRGQGTGTVERYSVLFFAMLATTINYDAYLADLFSGGRFSVVVQAERQFVPESVVFQNALAHGSAVYCRGGGPSSFTIFWFDHLDQSYCHTHRHGDAFFEYVWNNHRAMAEQAGGQFMEDRFSGKVRKNDIADAALAFSVDAGLDRERLCAMFGWDPEKPIVAVMSSSLNDGVFANRWSLFRDNYTWLERTTKAIAGIDTVNWFVKAHPSDEKNMVKVTGRDIFEKHNRDCPHVRFYPHALGNRSLPGIVDAVLTANGSAGLEYPCFGIPCVLGGEAFYSGFGFTHEPRTQQEYFALLQNIHTLKPLTPDQKARARVYAYIYLILSRVESTILPPVSVYADYDGERYLQDAVRLLERHDPLQEKLAEMIRIQVEMGYRHLLNYDWFGQGPHGMLQKNPLLNNAEGVRCP